jgi:hypothetical protein
MVTLINPNLAVQRNDPFTTGVVYMPIGLACFAGVLREDGFRVQVIDAFGEKPNQCWTEDPLLLRGLHANEISDRIDPDTGALVIYAINVAAHKPILAIIRAIRQTFETIPVIIIENSQAVTAYSVRRIAEDLLSTGVDYVVTGEPESRGLRLLNALKNNSPASIVADIDGIAFRNHEKTQHILPKYKIENLDSLPKPAWDLFPIKNYWKIKYGHGPFETGKYLPMLTSAAARIAAGSALFRRQMTANGGAARQSTLLMKWNFSIPNTTLRSFILKMSILRSMTREQGKYAKKA